MRKLSPILVLAAACGGAEIENELPPPIERDGGVVTPRDGGPPPPPRDGGVVVPPPCDGLPGTFTGQSISVAGEDRFYFLYVPSTYDCRTAAALLMDFHGTSGPPAPETAYQNDALVALAEAEGFIVVRPRSRFSGAGAQQVYRWDQNPGDLDRNVRFTAVLLDDLRSRYHVDDLRTYASGFSSGTNMISQLLTRPDLFRGYGFVGGGFWNEPTVPTVAPDAYRVYAVTGYRDYLVGTVQPMIDAVVDAGLDPAQIFYAENDSGHDLYAWHFEQMWTWLDTGVRPDDRPLAAGWSIDTAVPVDDALLEVTRNRSADLLVATSGGRVLRVSNGAWTEAGRAADVALTGICALDGGRAVAVGGGAVMLSDDDGSSWTRAPPAPETEGRWFGYAYLNDIACANTNHVLGAGYWSAVGSDDGGDSWFGRPMTYRGFASPAQVASVAVSSSSTAVAAGYFYLGRAAPGGDFVDIGTPVGVDWLNGVTNVGTSWWVVGDRGTVLRSIDDGVTFDMQSTPVDADLYAVHFANELVGIAVGNEGTALYTDDGGNTWLDVSPGLARFFGDVIFVDDTRALIVGEGGTALWYALP